MLKMALNCFFKMGVTRLIGLKKKRVSLVSSYSDHPLGLCSGVSSTGLLTSMQNEPYKKVDSSVVEALFEIKP